jgi:hypothetical protein
MCHKLPHEIEKEISDYIDALASSTGRDLGIGDAFVMVIQGYRREAGVANTDLYRVVKSLPTQIKYQKVSPESEIEDPDILTLRFSTLERGYGRPVLKRANHENWLAIVAMNKKLEAARYAAERSAKNASDIYVVWNTVYEQPDRTSPSYWFINCVSEGFVLEVFDGNGKLIERVRMISENGLACWDGDVFARMARVYAAQYFSHGLIANGSVFRIQHCSQMD